MTSTPLSRLERIRAALAEEKLDAIYISGPVDDVYGRHSQNRFYASGFSGSSGIALITRDRAILAADFRYLEQAERQSAPRGFEVWKSEGKHAKWVGDLIRHADLCGKKIGVSRSDMTIGSFEALQKAVGDMPWGLRPEVGTASPIIEKLRKHKDPAEIAALQHAIDIGDRAFEQVEATLVPGMTEKQVAGAIERAIRDLGGDGLSFDTIVACGHWAAMPHATPRDEPITASQPIVVDMGVLAGGYCSDLTRTTVLGQLSPELRIIYEVVAEAQGAAIAGVEAGMSGEAAHALAHDVITAAGHEEHFGHGLGHGVGLEVHETPYLGKTSEDTLEEGMVFTIEPGIYVPGLGGVRIEDVVLLENGKARVLSHARKLAPTGV